MCKKPSCPKCGSTMEKKTSKYGEFWGCTKFSKCKGLLNIEIPKLELHQINYFKLFNTNEMQQLAKEVFTNNDTCEYSENEDIKKYLGDDTFCYTVLEELLKQKRFFDISKITYCMHLVRGHLTYNFNYWIDRASYSKNYKEKDIKKIIIDTWKENIFSKLNMEYIANEYIVGNTENMGLVDILAYNKKNNNKVFIEIKSPKVKGKKAVNQLNRYLNIYKYFNNDTPEGYIIGKGYPFGIYDNSLGYVSFVIEKNKISFIPWKILY